MTDKVGIIALIGGVVFLLAEVIAWVVGASAAFPGVEAALGFLAYAAITFAARGFRRIVARDADWFGEDDSDPDVLPTDENAR